MHPPSEDSTPNPRNLHRTLKRQVLLLAPLLALASLPACAAAEMQSDDIKTATTLQSTFVQNFDASKGELPEGIAIRGEVAYVGFAPTSTIVRVNLKTGAREPFGKLPPPVPNKGFMTGLAIDDAGYVYAALASFASEVQAGIYRVPPTGGAAELFASDPNMPFPNGLAFDVDGSLYVTDSGTGSVFRIGKKGDTIRWATGAELTGKQGACGAGTGAGFDIGANGIFLDRENVYVVNTDKATLVRISKVEKGAPSPTIAFGPDCTRIGGADGLTRDAEGNFFVAVNRQDKIARIDARMVGTDVARGLDFPASFAWSGDTLYATNFALSRASNGGSAAPGLVRFARTAK